MSAMTSTNAGMGAEVGAGAGVPGAPAPALRFHVLGELRGECGGRPLDLGTRQQRALLAVLLLHRGAPVAAGALVDALWGEEPPARAVGTIRTYASRLRKVLPADVIVSYGDGYLLRVPGAPHEYLDLARFERHTAAARAASTAAVPDPARARRELTSGLDLWTGTPLAGLSGPYAAAWRDRLTGLRVDVLEQRLALDLTLGLDSEIVPELTALSAEHPLRENLRALLMRALHSAGRTAEALTLHADTRRLLADALGTGPGPELTAAHAHVLVAAPAKAPAVARRAVTPAQLPCATADFAGRERYVEELSGLFPGVALCAISGIAGVGKTALAVHLAHRVQGGYPDGQLFADLRGAGADPADPGDVLAAFLRAVHVSPKEIPEGCDRRAALFRTRLAGRRVLLVLDNARDAAQIRPLLPGVAGCAVVVTGRTAMAGLPGVHRVELPLFSEAEGIALIGRIVGEERVAAEPAAVRVLLAACGHLPLALRIVAARLAARPRWTLAFMAERLADERRRLGELRAGDLAVESAFELGYVPLESEEARAFRLLSLIEGQEFPVAAARALLDRDDAGALCELLTARGLLESPVGGRYRYHDLLRLFARKRCEEADPEADREAARTRLLEHYFATALHAGTVLDAGDAFPALFGDPVRPGETFDSGGEARTWRDREAGTLYATLADAARRGPYSVRRAASVLALWAFYGDESRVPERAAAVDALLGAALRTGDLAAELRVRYTRAYCDLSADRLDSSYEALRAGLDLLAAAGEHPRWRAVVLYLLAWVSRKCGRHGESLAYADQLASMEAGLGERHWSPAYTLIRARPLDLNGRGEEAVEAARRAVHLATERANPGLMSSAHEVLAHLLNRLGRHDESAAHSHECLLLARAEGRLQSTAGALIELTTTLRARGRYGEAVGLAEEAVRVAAGQPRRRIHAASLRALGEALREAGEEARARTQLSAAADLYAELGSPKAGEVRRLAEL